MDLAISGRRILVCGASRGLGAAIANELASEGARLAVAARGSSDLKAVAMATNAVQVSADLSTPVAPGRAVEQAILELGGLDGLVVNSGGPPAGSFASVDDDSWNAAIQGTLMMAIRTIRAALPSLASGRQSSIVVVLSSSVREPIPNLVTSNVLRPALNGLIKSLVTEIAPIRINGIAPGRVSTGRVEQLDRMRSEAGGVSLEDVRSATRARIPLDRYGEPAEVARVAAFLLSSAASYVNGVTVGVDGGLVRSLP